MLQRVMISMALSCEPEVLLADEPTTALDVTIQAQILELMRQLRERVGTAIVLITHDLGVVAEVCDHVNVMYAGLIVESAPVAELFRRPLHPYTQGLLGSIPRYDHPEKELTSIPGSVPNLITPPPGCRFHPRCPYAMPVCKERRPESLPQGEDHTVSCFLYESPAEPVRGRACGDTTPTGRGGSRRQPAPWGPPPCLIGRRPTKTAPFIPREPSGSTARVTSRPTLPSLPRHGPPSQQGAGLTLRPPWGPASPIGLDPTGQEGLLLGDLQAAQPPRGGDRPKRAVRRTRHAAVPRASTRNNYPVSRLKDSSRAGRDSEISAQFRKRKGGKG